MCGAQARGPWHFQRGLWPKVNKHSQPAGSAGSRDPSPRLCQVPAAKSLPIPRGPEGREGLRWPWQGWAAGREAARRRGQTSGPHLAGSSAGQSRTGHVASSSGPGVRTET